MSSHDFRSSSDPDVSFLDDEFLRVSEDSKPTKVEDQTGCTIFRRRSKRNK